jgi:capsular polysaccharide biosynthesis protein
VGRLNGPPSDWDEGPGLVESILGYKWLVAAAILLGAVLAFGWTSRQPVRYEGVARVFLQEGSSLGQDRPDAIDPGRNVRNQAELMSSPDILEGAAKLSGNRVPVNELRKRLTVDPEREADVITVRVLDETPRGAADLADAVITAYRRRADQQAQKAAAQTIQQLEGAQRKLEADGARVDAALGENPGNPLLKADRAAINKKLVELAAEKFSISAESSLAGSGRSFQERATIPENPVQPQPLRATAGGALLGFVVGAALTWLLAWRRLSATADGRPSWMPAPHEQAAGPVRQTGAVAAENGNKALRPGSDHASPKPRLRLGGLLPNRPYAPKGGNGSSAGIVEFDKLNGSIEKIFDSLDGDRQKLYTSNVPELYAQDIAHRFRLDHVAVLLKMKNGVQVVGTLGFDADQLHKVDRYELDLVRDIAGTGPRLIDGDQAAELMGNGWAAGQAGSLALVPLASNNEAFGILLIGRHRGTSDGHAFTDQDLEDINRWVSEATPYLKSWWLLRHLRVRLGVFE